MAHWSTYYIGKNLKNTLKNKETALRFLFLKLLLYINNHYFLPFLLLTTKLYTIDIRIPLTPPNENPRGTLLITAPNTTPIPDPKAIP